LEGPLSTKNKESFSMEESWHFPSKYAPFAERNSN
jgi:hypothetical protein